MSIKLPKLFLDSGDPEETRKAKGLLGHIDGQTTNPSLVAKNPEIKKMIDAGKKLTEADLLNEYKNVIMEIEKETAGPVSVEVYADWDSTASDLLKQAENMYGWGNNIYMKFPTTQAGIDAAHEFSKQGGRVNMTLVFTQNQAAAVYEATRNAAGAFISPFMGRWDDRGYNGIDLVKNIIKQYREYEKIEKKESHVKVLAASIRTMDHFYSSIFLGADILTVPIKIIQEWVSEEKWVPDERYRFEPENLKSIMYEEIPPGKPLSEYKIERVEGDLLDEGLVKFAADWKSLIK